MSTQITHKTVVKDENTLVPSNNVINFTGAGVTVSNVGGEATVVIPGPPASSGLVYKGLWDATANNPVLTSSVGTAGDFYIVSTAGTTNLNGINDWQVSDWAIFEGGAWQKIDNHDIPAYNTVKDESTTLPQRSTLKFTGTGVTASDAGGETVVNIPGNVPTTNYGLFAQTQSSTPISGTNLETSLISSGVGTLTVPANGFQVGDSFNGVLIGHLSCVGTATLHIRVKTASGILLADTGVMAMNATTNKHWKLDVNFTVRTLGAPTVASIASGGLFAYTKNSGLNFEGVNFSIVNNTTFDTTVLNTLVITAQWNTNNAGNSIFSEIFLLNKIY